MRRAGWTAGLHTLASTASDRHDALSDAFATAQLLQIAIAHAARKGFDTPASLHALEKARRHLHQSG
jgi:DNA polymerase III epsilon subunit-like protein